MPFVKRHPDYAKPDVNHTTVYHHGSVGSKACKTVCRSDLRGGKATDYGGNSTGLAGVLLGSLRPNIPMIVKELPVMCCSTVQPYARSSLTLVGVE